MLWMIDSKYWTSPSFPESKARFEKKAVFLKFACQMTTFFPRWLSHLFNDDFMKRKQLFFFFLLTSTFFPSPPPPPIPPKKRCSCKDDRFCFHVFTLLSWCPPFYEKRSTFEFFWPLPVTVVTFNWLPDPEGMAKCLPVRASFSQTMWESLNWELIAFWLHLSNSSAPIHTHKG